MQTSPIQGPVAKRSIISALSKRGKRLTHLISKNFQSLPFIVNLGNKKSRELFAKEKVVLDQEGQRILERLKEDGIAITSVSALFGNNDHFLKTLSYIRKKEAGASLGRKKQFLRYIWGEDAPLLDLDNPFVNLSLHPKILSIVSAYFELFPQFVFSSANITIPNPDQNAAGSQRWHRDQAAGDKKLCKVFLYLSDVDQSAGPFTYLPQTHTTGAQAKMFPILRANGYYPKEGEVEHSPLAKDIKPCLGNAGTIIFCDTTGLHRGGLSSSKERIMATASYVSPGSEQKPRFVIEEKTKQKTLTLPRITRLALGYY